MAEGGAAAGQNSGDTQPELLSIILLSYKNLPLLREMLPTVYTQDYPALQLIISDDGSEGFDAKALKAEIDAARPANLLEVLVRTGGQNQGTVRNVEAALALCRGAYIWILAADDCIADATAAGRFVRAFQADASVQLLCAQVDMYSEDMREKLGEALSPQRLRLLEAGTALEQFAEFARDCCLPAAGVCYRASAFAHIGPLPRECRLIEDWPAYIRLARKGFVARRLAGTVARHRHGGISSSALRYPSAAQRWYSKDLLFVYRHEVRPFLGLLPPRDRAKARGRAVLRWLHHRFGFVYGLIEWLRQ